jgi:adenylyltransferase/sulfurtransferase
VVVDGTDNFQTRYLSNDACVLLGKPNVYGSVLRWEGQASVFATPDGPCYRCLFREPPPPGLVPTCVEAGVLGVLPGLVGMVQATETLKLLLGHGDTLAGRLLLLDAARMRFRTIELRRDPSCPACGTRELRTLIDYEAFCGVHATLESATSDSGNGAGEPARDGDVPADITPAELADRLRRGETLEVIDVREPYEHAIARLPGARLVPLATVASAAGSLDPEREIVVHCHHGMRSARAAAILREAGFRRVRNLVGGIDRWSTDVDASVPRY